MVTITYYRVFRVNLMIAKSVGLGKFVDVEGFIYKNEKKRREFFSCSRKITWENECLFHLHAF
jgi:hypothetical protein|uniref:Uncharacterized protein n=1 Tax=Halalkalibacterium halodurans TaxID=86665 RepID=A0A0M0KFY3_ALKHA